MLEHEKLGFGIGLGSDRRTGKPGVADLARIQHAAPGIVFGPRPALDIKKSRGSNHDSVLSSDNRERNRAASLAPGDRSIDVTGGLAPVLRHRTPLVK